MEMDDASAWLREQVAQLREQVARQAEDLSTLEASHVGMSPFVFCCVGFSLSLFLSSLLFS